MANPKQRTATNDFLVNFLRSLPATGPNGFEGLMRDLLEQWTGLTFRLARSGSQFGKDGTSETQGQFTVTFETKRYKDTTELNARELSGELLQVKTSFPDLDLWVLAATKEVGDLAEDLRQSAEFLNIGILIVDARPDGIGPLQVLCAEYPHVVIEFCKRNKKNAEEKQITDHLNGIKTHHSYQSALERLRKTLSLTVFGNASARHDAYDWLKNHVGSKSQAYSVFSQDIGLLEIGNRRIPRGTLNQSLDTWCNNWKTDASICALVGEEGTGKTWALFSWLLEKFGESHGPIVLPITTGQLPASSDLVEIIATTLHQRCRKSKEFWRRRIESWQKDPKGEGPLFLLCLDGLNERPDFPWRSILAQAASDEMLGRIAIIMTSRREIWQRHVSSGVKETIVETFGYNDAELQLALRASPLSLSQIPQALRPLIRKPRYCDLVIRHFAAMVESGDMTVERLLYEDCKDKQKRKLNHPVTDEDFRAILCALAKQYHDGISSFPKSNLKQFLPVTDATGVMLQEIIDGGLLVPSGGIKPVYKVDPRRLVHGLGMLLADHISNAAGNSVIDLIDVVRAWLEPQPDMDTKASIVGAAVFFSIIDPAYPSKNRRALLLFWVNARNLPDEQEENIVAYLPECADDMTSIADSCWRRPGDNGAAHTRLARAFLVRRDDERVKPALIRAANRWMSYVNVKGHRFERGTDDKNLPEIAEAIVKRFGCKLVPGEYAKFLEWSFPITDDDGLLRLARFALLIISGGDRTSFVDAFIRWAISSRLMGRFSEADEAAWTLRLSDEDLWSHFEPALANMADSGDETLKKAAHLLASCLGCREAYTLRATSLAGLYPPNGWEIEYEKDPFASMFGAISFDQCVPCMMRDDLSLLQIERKIHRFLFNPSLDAPTEFVDRLHAMADVLPVEGFRAKFCHSIEDHKIEHSQSILARFTPNAHGNLLRRVVRTLPTRDEEGRRQLLIHLPEISLVLLSEEVNMLVAVLKEYWIMAKDWKELEPDSIMDREMFAEAEGFLALAMHLPLEEVAETILSRPVHAFDLRLLQYWFAPLPEAAISNYLDRLLSESDTHVLTRLIWVLSNSRPALSASHRAHLKNLLKTSDDTLKGVIYRFVRATEDTDLVRHVLGQEHSLLSPEKEWADQWYFEILCHFGGDIPFSSILSSIRLADLGLIVHRRGCRQEEVSVFANLLNEVWQRIANNNGVDTTFPSLQIKASEDCAVSFAERSQPSEDTTRCLLGWDTSWGSGNLSTADDLKKAFTPQTESDEQFVARQRAFREKIEELASREETCLWSTQVPLELLQKVCRDYPDLAKVWVETGIENRQLLVSCEGFYQSLCAALADIDPPVGFTLWHRLRNETGNIRIIDFETNGNLMMSLPFSARPSVQATAARAEIVDGCVSDAALIELATIATACNCQDWLLSQVRMMLHAPQLWCRAKGLMLACLTDISTDFEELVTQADISSTWVENLIDKFKELNARNLWARYWYDRFLSVDDGDEAYSAYTLFLKCTDRRCRLWMHTLESNRETSGLLKNRRVKFRLTNYQQIERAIKENEKDLKDHFLTLKFQKGQLMPFI